MPGYRPVPAADPVEQSLRDQWYATEGSEREIISLKLAKHIWDRTEKLVAEDRKRHPNKSATCPLDTRFSVVQVGGICHDT